MELELNFDVDNIYRPPQTNKELQHTTSPPRAPFLSPAPRFSANGGRGAKHSRSRQGQSSQDCRDDGDGDSKGGVAATIEKGPPAGMGTSFAAKGRVSAWLMSPSPRNLFIFRVACVMIFFGMHNLLQVREEKRDTIIQSFHQNMYNILRKGKNGSPLRPLVKRVLG